MMFATIVRYNSPDNKGHYCLELNPADPMTELDALNGFFEDVKKNFCCCNGSSEHVLHFHPTSAVQIEAIKDKKLNLPVITSAQIYGNIKFKLVQAGAMKNKKVCVFYSREYKEEELNKWLLKRTADDIVVIPSVPSDIPVVGGVICGEIIPPLCHVALLCQNRKTPCCFVKNCVAMIRKGNLADIVVEGVITKTGFYLDGAEGFEKLQHQEAPKIEIKAPNTSVTKLIDIHEDKEHAKDLHVVGAKAAQLVNVESHYSQPIFKGTFVIPFHHYDKHVYKNNDTISTIKVKTTRARGNAENFNEFTQVQGMIQKHKIDDELVQSVIEKIKQHNMTSVIFRSSTNAEDLTGFNGAGLYESVPLTGDDVHSPQQVAKAIKTVWASIWSPK